MRITVDKRIKTAVNAEYVEKSDNTTDQTIDQVDDYLRGDRTQFTIPLLTVGIQFQKSVWNALLKVPYGQTFTYLQLAKSVSNEKAVRAVTSANGANAISLIVPCHQIIGGDGGLVGYAAVCLQRNACWI